MKKASEAATSAPVIGCFRDVDGSTNYLFIEKQVLFGGALNFCKCLSMWFSLLQPKSVNEIALFFQEFVFGLPASKVISTYLTVCSDIQSFIYSSL